FEYGGC
ncbi:hypothetical protein D030_3750B, partial [Vibrio parahaemolyticus AQ3810]